jgi:hypothetical protein
MEATGSYGSALPDRAMPLEPIVAVFDSKTMALRTVAELRAAEVDDIWLAVVRGETDAGETLVACEGEEPCVLSAALLERGSSEALSRRFDGILPPGSAVLSARVRAKVDAAVAIVEVTGGHIEHV